MSGLPGMEILLAELGHGKTQLVVIIAYLAFLLLLGFAASRLFRGTREDYQLASHSIGPVLLLLSLFGTTMTAFALVGSTGEAYREGIGVYGLLASASGIVHSMCFLVVGVPLWRLGRRHGFSTQVEFFRRRLDNDFIGILLFPLILGLIIPYLMIGVMGAGITIQGLTAGAFPNVKAFEVYAPAKQSAVGESDPADATEADAAEVDTTEAGADSSQASALPASVNEDSVAESAPARTLNRGASGGIPPWLGSLAICLIVLCYVFFGGMRGTAWANAFQTVFFMVLGGITFYVISAKLGKQDSLWENLQAIAAEIPASKSTRGHISHLQWTAYLLIPLSVAMFPHVFQHWLTARSSRSFKLPIVAHPLFVLVVWAPCVLIGVWATTSLMPDKPPLPTLPDGSVNANAILPFMVNTMTNDWMAGLLAAGILAAIMSSLDSQFLCIGTMFNNDIVTHYGGADRFSDRQQVWITRGFVVGVVAVTYLLSIQGYRSVFSMATWCFTGYAALFPLVFAALYWRRLTAAGAILSVLFTMASWGYFFWQSGFGAAPPTAIPLGITVFGSAAVLAGVSLTTPAPSAEKLAKFFGDR